MEQTLTLPRRNALLMTALAYIPAVLAMMPVGVLVPFLETLKVDLATSGAQLGLSIALFSIPAAVLATVGGGLIDQYGIRPSMLFAAAATALGSVLASQVHSVLALDGAMVVGGVGFGALCVLAPCLVMASLSEGRRTRAMAFVSTYAPTGYAAGLLLAVLFANAGEWRRALLVHGTLMAAAFVLLALLLPPLQSATDLTQEEPLRLRLARLLRVFREPRVLRLAIAVALPNAVSYGTSLSAPAYLARVNHLSIAVSSASVASAKLAALIVGGVSVGLLLSRAIAPRVLYAVMVVVGLAAQATLYLVPGGLVVAILALMAWLFAFGGMTGGAMTLLPAVTARGTGGGSASGLVNQFISLASFATPSIWLSLHAGSQFVLLAGACLLVSLIALPGIPARATP